MNLITEPAVPDIAAFCGKTASNDTETYHTMSFNTQLAVPDITAFHGNTATNDKNHTLPGFRGSSDGTRSIQPSSLRRFIFSHLRGGTEGIGKDVTRMSIAIRVILRVTTH